MRDELERRMQELLRPGFERVKRAFIERCRKAKETDGACSYSRQGWGCAAVCQTTDDGGTQHDRGEAW